MTLTKEETFYMFLASVPDETNCTIGQVWVKSPQPAPTTLPPCFLFSRGWSWTHEWSSGRGLPSAGFACVQHHAWLHWFSLSHWCHFTLNYSDTPCHERCCLGSLLTQSCLGSHLRRQPECSAPFSLSGHLTNSGGSKQEYFSWERNVCFPHPS